MSADLENIKVNLEKAGKALEDEIEKVVSRWAQQVQGDAIIAIEQSNAIATNQLRSNVRFTVLREVGKIIGVVGTGSSVPYAIFRHQGTKPHFMKVQPLIDWVIKKGLVKTRTGKARKLSAFSKGRNADTYMREATSIAHAIKWKIARKGTTGVPFLKIAMNLNRERLFAAMAKISV